MKERIMMCVLSVLLFGSSTVYAGVHKIGESSNKDIISPEERDGESVIGEEESDAVLPGTESSTEGEVYNGSQGRDDNSEPGTDSTEKIEEQDVPDKDRSEDTKDESVDGESKGNGLDLNSISASATVDGTVTVYFSDKAVKYKLGNGEWKEVTSENIEIISKDSITVTAVFQDGEELSVDIETREEIENGGTETT